MRRDATAFRLRARRGVVLVVVVLVLVPLIFTNVRMYQPGDLGRAEAQLDYLEGALAGGAADRMQDVFPEGFVFTWTLYALASAQLAGQLPPGDATRAHRLDEARRAVEQVLSDRARSVFRQEMEPPLGAFYNSWALYALAVYVRAAGPEAVPDELLETFRVRCAAFAAALRASPSPFLPSYPFLAWPADTAVGVAALGIHDTVFASEYEDVIRAWIGDASARADPAFAALTHEADAETGAPAGGVRGSSLALMARVLVDADAGFSHAQYTLLREHFVDQTLLAPGVREYPHGVDGAGDVDSGPILLGFSGPALVVGAAAARAHGDLELSRQLLAVVETAGLPIELGGRRRYAGGLVPVGDAFIAWARTTPVPSGARAPEWTRLTRAWWQLPAHLLSLLLAALLAWRARVVWRA